MNKNDLRFKKTEIAIKDAYISLKKNSEKSVKVKELCDKAMINKTTFYSHYETMEVLNRQICSEFVSQMLRQCPHIYEILSNTKAFVNSIYTLFSENEKTIFKLYGSDTNALVNDIEKELLETYILKDISEDTELAIRFCVGGVFRLLIFDKNKEQINKIIDLTEKFVDMLSE